MNAHSELRTCLEWLLNHSLQAGVLVLLVLLLQWVFRRQLTNRWRFALWWIVLARLLLPFSPESAMSLFNIFQPNVHLESSSTSVSFARLPENKSINIPEFAVVPAELELPPINSVPTMESVLVAPEPPNPMNAAPSGSVPAANCQFLRPRPPATDYDFILGAVAIWLTGVLGLAGVVAIQLFRFYQKLAKASAPADPNLEALLNDCQREFGLSRPIQLLETDAVQSPALFGLVRLRLLLPRGFGGKFNRRELRYIFLHELAHVKRGDLWLSWLVLALQILHWFNPLLWLGFARLRADRELACDELALLRAGDDAGTAYGETVVKLLEQLSGSTAVPGLVGILEDKKQMRRRISMIARFRKPGRWSVLAAILVAAMAAAALTDAQTGKPGNPADTFSTKTGLSHSMTPLDLTGKVFAKGWTTLAVPATVFIEAAAPKTGTSTFCPSCYADCNKHSRTDAQGHFRIESLDPQLTFKILVVAKGYKP
ncbi:MAG TPA: M56 family metallopeptidase, partial [Candidatus Acidoferrum sp.]|nr:M56 family metallopeptidase [Candidatus Acidoferrum sp.]